MKIIITGASSGLGKEIAFAMREHTIIDWSLETGVDVSNQLSVQLAASLFVDAYEQADILINCAGINILASIPTLQQREWNDVMNTNARGAFFTVQALCEHMKGGTILNVISNASHMPMTHSLAYCASKAALEMMTRQMAHELYPSHKIVTFGISPNRLEGTAMSKDVDKQVARIRGWDVEKVWHYQQTKMPMGETEPAAIAELVAFLLQEPYRHAYLNGCILELGK